MTRSLALFTAGTLSCAALVQPAPLLGLTASFDWSMPDRFGLDADPADGLVDYATTPDDVTPKSWLVKFNACASSGKISTYSWAVDGVPAGKSEKCDVFSYKFPDEGAYQVSLTVSDSREDVTVTRRVLVQDWLIVSLGDSYASGEGNPDFPIAASAISHVSDLLFQIEGQQAVIDAALRVLQDAEAQGLRVRQLAEDVANRLSAFKSAQEAQAEACDPSKHPKVVIPGSKDFQNCAQAGVNTANASADLVKALATLGAESLINSIGDIPGAMNNLVATAEAARAAAEGAFNRAVAELASLRDMLTNARANLQAVWEDRRCHRSAKAGSALAALAIERVDPRTSVTFVHLACSGATITSGLLGGYKGIDAEGLTDLLKPQIEEVRDLAGGREIDALLVSIGGNDAHFASIIKACITGEPCHNPPTILDTAAQAAIEALCVPTGPFAEECRAELAGSGQQENARDLLADGLKKLPGRYAKLSQKLVATLPDLPSRRVYITEYPDSARDEKGGLCGFDPQNPGEYFTMPGISASEMNWFEADMTVGLNDSILAAVKLHGWTLVGGIFEAFKLHGYCASDYWFVRFQETFPIEGKISGAVHPNAGGQAAYRDRILAALMLDMYPAGTIEAPRPPLVAGGSGGAHFIRGDCNGDGRGDISDAICGLEHLFLGGSAPGCRKTLDVNDDGIGDISDSVALLGYLFLGTTRPPEPFGACGSDPTEDSIPCETHPACP